MVQLNKLKKSIFLFTAIGLVIFSFVVIFLFNLNPVSAQEVGVEIVDTTGVTGQATGLTGEDPRIIIARIIRIFLGVLGTVALILVIYGGFLYMTSGGDPEKVNKAKRVLINAFIGLLIIMTAFAIVWYIISQLEKALGLGPRVPSQYEYIAPGHGSGALGEVLQDHFPGVGMVVPRNTVIMVTFKEPFNPNSILLEDSKVCRNDNNVECDPVSSLGIDNCLCRGQLNPESVQLYRACDTIYPEGENIPETYNEANRSNPLVCNDWRGNEPEADKYVTDGEVIITPDLKTFVFNPYGTDPNQHLGSATTDITYITHLTNNIINLEKNQGAFTGQTFPEYRWDFTTNTTIDLTPPFVTGVYPVSLGDNGQPLAANAEGAIAHDRNNRLRVDFSEPVIPPLFLTINNPDLSLLTSPDKAFKPEIIIADITNSEAQSAITGNYVVGINQYRSVIFKPNGDCGVGKLINSCGDEVFCLPANSIIQGTVYSPPISKLLNGVGPSTSIFPADGVVDAALNALDTNGRLGYGNGQTEGAIDNFIWTFATNSNIDLISPRINTGAQETNPVDEVSGGVGLTPDFAADSTNGVEPDSIVSAFFTKSMDPSTTTNHYVSIISDVWSLWYTGGLYCPIQVSPDGSTFCKTNDRAVVINHALFPKAQSQDDVPLLFPKLQSGLQDMKGNCFNPVLGPNCENVTEGYACCAEYSEIGGQMIIQESDTCPY